MNDSNNPVDLTGADEPAKKVPKLLTGFFRKYDPSDPAQVAVKVDRERKEARTPSDLHGQVTAHSLAIRRDSDEKPGHRATISC